jgi:hypothetical protein
MLRVAKPGSKLIIVDETEDLAKKYEKSPVAGNFYKGRDRKIESPVDLLPPEVEDVQLKSIAHGDLYCLCFRKPIGSVVQ